MANQQDLPGHRRRTPEQIERRARMTAAVVEFHRAVMPVLVARRPKGAAAMSEHYTQSTESDLKYCARCQRRTRHAVSGGRIGRCTESDGNHAGHGVKKRRAGPAPDAKQNEPYRPVLRTGALRWEALRPIRSFCFAGRRGASPQRQRVRHGLLGHCLGRARCR